jgi:hypothetical protein
VPQSATPVKDWKGEVCAYKMADGSTVRLIVALEVESPTENEYKYLTSEQDIANAGFEALEYNEAKFA